ncbi:MAG: formate/nitrite transporter family protein [Pygmaiobacter massiliensis]|nr:formate/nitrite transporter family protein [Pygmaiobacter massiliensis]
MRQMQIFLNGILAGLLISVGGAVFLSCEVRLAGCVFFSLGLITIITRGFYLFTGKAGYALGQNLGYLGFLGVVWLGNFAGTALAALALRLTRVGPALAEKAFGLWQTKLSDSFVSLFFLAVFCGLLMYLAVDGYKSADNQLVRVLLVVFCVAVFILCGFEHCVADMFYGWMGLCWSANALGRLLWISLGNLLGALLVPLCERYTCRLKTPQA